MRAWFLVAIFAVVALPAWAGEADAVPNRYPQPVRVGDLVGRKLIGPEESQPLLGHVAGVERRAEGGIVFRIRTWSVLPWRGRTVEVPAAAVALMGEYVALLGLSPAQLAALPEAPPPAPVPEAEQIRVGLVKPFH